MTTLTIPSRVREEAILTPRTPHTSRIPGTPYTSAYPRTPHSSRYPVPSSARPTHPDDVDEQLLKNEEQMFVGFEDEEDDEEVKKPTWTGKDRRGIIFLIVLYLIQGVPMGLVLGSIPFLLREKLSYSQLGTFALSSFPFSSKLLWSPIVDSIYFPSVGRRRSWVIPLQFLLGSTMFYISWNVDKFLGNPGEHLTHLTFVFTCMVMVSATQDIAVDGWALTLLSKDALSYASTCQTIGMNSGYLLSFTLFLALNSESFVAKWGLPTLHLGTYLQFWGGVTWSVAVWVAFFQRETKTYEDHTPMPLWPTYKTIWQICKMRNIQMTILVHTLGKIGYAANEAATSLKMIDKGFKREDLAIAVLIDFPCQIVGGWIAAKWARGDQPLRPWIWSFWPRLGFCLLGTVLVYKFPSPPISSGFFAGLVVHTVLSSFIQTVQMVGMSAFHTRISDPLIGGTYMTLMATFTQLGNVWPKWFVLRGIDWLSVATCQIPGDLTLGEALCLDHEGKCVVERDGYYIVSGVCMVLGGILFITLILPMTRKLQCEPLHRIIP
ncbi:acetyl-coenzyme A transporter 1-domain-containing protein [Flagelloscypha sp. PMI_526]|nr:acetyl-coenzyme A transporter 1-domain-containing protein [Flagelloscypha sp. PMI_526]